MKYKQDSYIFFYLAIVINFLNVIGDKNAL